MLAFHEYSSNLTFHILRQTGKKVQVKKKKKPSPGNNCTMARSLPFPITEKPAQKKKKINRRLGFLSLDAANDAHRKYCREKVPEREVNWIASVCLCIFRTKSVSFYSGPKQASAQSPWLSPGMTSVTRDPSAGSSRTISLSSSFISSQRPQLNEYFSFVSVFSRVTFIKPKHCMSSQA